MIRKRRSAFRPVEARRHGNRRGCSADGSTSSARGERLLDALASAGGVERAAG
jgi:hypothetical protein